MTKWLQKQWEMIIDEVGTTRNKWGQRITDVYVPFEVRDLKKYMVQALPSVYLSGPDSSDILRTLLFQVLDRQGNICEPL